MEIKGNEAVDEAPKNATKFPIISLNIHPPASDIAQLLVRLIFKNWSSSWKNQIHDNKLLKIKKEPLPQRKKRYEEMKIARLRIGHTRITYS